VLSWATLPFLLAIHRSMFRSRMSSGKAPEPRITSWKALRSNADPIARNARLGRYTNFVNLLDCCAIAVPAGFRSDGLAFGVTLVAPACSDASLAGIADSFHRASDCGMGVTRDAHIPEASRVVLASIGMRIPATRLRAFAAFAYYSMRLRLRGLKFREREKGLVTAAERTRMDACWSIGLSEPGGTEYHIAWNGICPPSSYCSQRTTRRSFTSKLEPVIRSNVRMLRYPP